MELIHDGYGGYSCETEDIPLNNPTVGLLMPQVLPHNFGRQLHGAESSVKSQWSSLAGPGVQGGDSRHWVCRDRANGCIGGKQSGSTHRSSVTAHCMSKTPQTIPKHSPPWWKPCSKCCFSPKTPKTSCNTVIPDMLSPSNSNPEGLGGLHGGSTAVIPNPTHIRVHTPASAQHPHPRMHTHTCT